jgi:hypothetical protein
VKKHISNIQSIMTMSRRKRTDMPIGSRVRISDGRLTSNKPAPEERMIEPHRRPGGSGSSGAVHSSLGRAKKSKKRPGPNKCPK